MEFIFAKTVDTVLQNALEGGFQLKLSSTAGQPAEA
jgi:hypothetical protein